MSIVNLLGLERDFDLHHYYLKTQVNGHPISMLPYLPKLKRVESLSIALGLPLDCERCHPCSHCIG